MSRKIKNRSWRHSGVWVSVLLPPEIKLIRLVVEQGGKKRVLYCKEMSEREQD